MTALDKTSGTTRIIILGSPRSGTSLLSRMINAHPSIGVPQESHVYNQFFDLRHLYGPLTERENQVRLLNDICSFGFVRHWSPAPVVSDAINRISGPGFGAVFDALMVSWAVLQGNSGWGEKTPHHINYVDPLLASFPDAKIVHIVRDPRDACMSMIRARFGPKNPFAAAAEWCGYLEKIRRIMARYPEIDTVSIRYEDLLADPTGTLQRVCRIIGIEYAESMLRFYEEKNLYDTDHVNRINLQQPIIKENAGKWRVDTDVKSIKLIERIATPCMLEYGYEAAHRDLPALSKERRRLYGIDNRVKRLRSMLVNGRGYVELLRRGQLIVGLYTRKLLRGSQNDDKTQASR